MPALLTGPRFPANRGPNRARFPAPANRGPAGGPGPLQAPLAPGLYVLILVLPRTTDTTGYFEEMAAPFGHARTHTHARSTHMRARTATQPCTRTAAHAPRPSALENSTQSAVSALRYIAFAIVAAGWLTTAQPPGIQQQTARQGTNYLDYEICLIVFAASAAGKPWCSFPE